MAGRARVRSPGTILRAVRILTSGGIPIVDQESRSTASPRWLAFGGPQEDRPEERSTTSTTSKAEQGGVSNQERGQADGTRYSAPGFDDVADLDEDGGTWPTSWALTRPSPAGESAIAELVARAVR